MTSESRQDTGRSDLRLRDGAWVPMEPPPGTDDRSPEAAALEMAEHGWLEYLRLGEPGGPLCIQTFRGVPGRQTGYLLRVENVETISDYLHVATLPELMDLLARWAPAVQAAAVAEREATWVGPTTATGVRLLTGVQAAARLGISRQAVHKRALTLGGVQVGTTWVFDADVVEAEARAKSHGG